MIDKAPDANDIARMHGLEYLRQHIDANGHRFDGQVDGRSGLFSNPPTLAETPYKRLAVHEAEDLLSQPRPHLEWLVEGWLPANDVTLLGADGGTGKTTLGLQLGHSCLIGASHWLERPIKSGPALYLSAEEPLKELQRRLGEVADRVAGGCQSPKQFGLISCADQDAVLAHFDRTGTIQPTLLYRDLREQVLDRGVRFLGLDAAADVFGGNENDRGQVRTFVRLLRGLALEAGCAILLLAHP